MKRVESEGKFTMDIALFWIDILMEVEENDVLLTYFENYLQIFPDEVSLWLKYLGVKAQLSGNYLAN